MACRLIGTEPLSELMLTNYHLDTYKHTSVKFDKIAQIFIHEKAFENVVWEMAVILSRGRSVNKETDRVQQSHMHAHYALLYE